MNRSLSQKNTAAAICSDLEEFISVSHMIGLKEETEPLTALCQKYQSEEQRILFLGASNTGKSTLINAMLGNCLLPTSMKAETALITHIVHGSSGDSARVFPKDRLAGVRELSQQQFFAEYQASQFGKEQIEAIHHGVISSPFQKDGLVFVDTPDLLCPEDAAAINAEIDVADAVVFVLNANRLLDLSERKWMREHLQNQNRKKVFFAVNWSESISEGDSQSLDIHLRNGLSGILLDQYGRFSSELYDARVFYIDALLAENARTGKAATGWKCGRFVSVPVLPEDYDCSGVPELVQALDHFLEEAPCYDRCFERMQQLTKQAQLLLSEKETGFRQKEAALSAQREILLAEDQAASGILNKIQRTFSLMGQALTNSTMHHYDLFLHDVAAGWESYAQSQKLPFGIAEQAQIACLQMKQGFSDLEKKWKAQSALTQEDLTYQEELNQIIQPISDAVTRYLGDSLQKMIQSANSEAETIIREYIQLLDQQCEELEKVDGDYFSRVDALENLISQLEGEKAAPQTSDSSANVLLSLFLFQNTTMAYDMLFRNISVDKLIQEGINRKATTLMVDISIGVLTGGGYWAGLLLHAAYKAVRRVQKADDYGREIFCSFQEPVVHILNEARDYIVQVTRKLHEDKILVLHERLESAFRNRIDAAQAQLEQNVLDMYCNRKAGQIDTQFAQQCIDRLKAVTQQCAARVT